MKVYRYNKAFNQAFCKGMINYRSSIPLTQWLLIIIDCFGDYGLKLTIITRLGVEHNPTLACLMSQFI